MVTTEAICPLCDAHLGITQSTTLWRNHLKVAHFSGDEFEFAQAMAKAIDETDNLASDDWSVDYQLEFLQAAQKLMALGYHA